MSGVVINEKDLISGLGDYNGKICGKFYIGQRVYIHQTDTGIILQGIIDGYHEGRKMYSIKVLASIPNDDGGVGVYILQKWLIEEHIFKSYKKANRSPKKSHL